MSWAAALKVGQLAPVLSLGTPLFDECAPVALHGFGGSALAAVKQRRAREDIGKLGRMARSPFMAEPLVKFNGR